MKCSGFHLRQAGKRGKVLILYHVKPKFKTLHATSESQADLFAYLLTVQTTGKYYLLRLAVFIQERLRARKRYEEEDKAI